MSYESLAQSPIENREDVLGYKALEAAETATGVEVNGTEIVAVEGKHGVVELVENVEDKMGQAALTSPRFVAKEDEDDVDLPASLEM